MAASSSRSGLPRARSSTTNGRRSRSANGIASSSGCCATGRETFGTDAAGAMKSEPFAVRNATADDVPAIAAIYSHHVVTGTASFELAPPTIDEMRERFDACWRGDYPYLAAERGGRIVGYAYAG